MRRILILIPLLLTGCMTAEEEARQQVAEAAALNAAIDQACQKEGYRPGTDAFRDCRIVVVQAMQQRRQELAVATAQHRQALLTTLQQQRWPAPRPPTYCTHTGMGGDMVVTNCR